MQGPSRALLGDFIPDEALGNSVIFGQSLFALSNGIGKAIGYGFGGSHTDIRYVNSFAAIGVLVFTLIPTLLSREQPRTIMDDVEDSTRRPFFAQLVFMWKEICTSPKAIRQVFVVQWFTYLSFSTTFIYIIEWVAGAETFGGNANAAHTSAAYKTYLHGVTFANRALLVSMLICIIFSLLLPSLTRLLGLKIWGTSLLLMGICLLCTLFHMNRIGAFIVILSIALPLAVAFTIPWAIISCSVAGPNAHQRGFLMSIFNLSQSIPGIFASLIGSLLIHLSDGRNALPLAFSGIASICGAIASLFVDLPEQLVGSVECPVLADKRQGCFPAESSQIEEQEKRSVSGNI